MGCFTLGSKTLVGILVVLLQNGLVQGIESLTRDGNRIYEFRRIPYAQTPMGDLRFEPPEPVAPWQGILDATNAGPQCVQVNQITESVEGVEDCLYLNVYTPVNRKGLLPIMVYIHGGAFLSGSANLYNPAYILDENVLLVTMNYRLGALGFLNTGDYVARGNQGLKDQALALRWIQMNIKYFGGDPKQVTLFGESSGSMSVGFHLLSPESKGLFSRAIMQSGSPLGNWALNKDPVRQSKKYAAKFNCSYSSTLAVIACLRKVDASDLGRAHLEALPLIKDKSTLFLPSIETVHDEGTFLGEDPYVTLKSGKVHAVPLITGVTEHEGLLVSAVLLGNQTHLKYASEHWHEFASNTLDYDVQNKEASAKIREFYFPQSKLEYTERDINGFTDVFSDRKFVVPVHQFVETYKQFAPVRLYLHSYSAEASLGDILEASQTEKVPKLIGVLWDLTKRWFARKFLGYEIEHLGVCHADELQLLFNWQLSSFISHEHRDYQVSKKIVELWTDFAKDRLDQEEWPTVNKTSVQYLNINTVNKILNEPFTKRIQFWEDLNL